MSETPGDSWINPYHHLDSLSWLEERPARPLGGESLEKGKLRRSFLAWVLFVDHVHLDVACRPTKKSEQEPSRHPGSLLDCAQKGQEGIFGP